MEYSHEFGSEFPNELIEVGTKKDIEDSVAPLISLYYAYVEANNIDGAIDLYNQNKDLLDPYIINMQYINRLEESIYNTGLLSLKKTTTIISSNEPAYQEDDSCWMQEY